MRCNKYLLLAGLVISAMHASAQESPADSLKVRQKIAATPVKSYISYKTLSQFFQTSVTNGTTGGFDFKSSLWAIEKLFNGDPYEKYYESNTGKFERNFEITLGVHKNSDGTYSTLTGGFKYAPINDRDKSDHNFMTDPGFKAALLARHDVMFETNQLYRKQYVDGLQDLAAQKTAALTLRSQHAKFDTTHNYNDLPKEFNLIRDSLIKAYSSSAKAFANAPDSLYALSAKKVDMGSLLTLSFNPGYDYNHQHFDTTSFVAVYVVGLGDPDKPTNLDFQGEGLFTHDTLGTVHNLARFEAIAKAGISKTLVNDEKSNPLIEVEGQFEDDDHFNTSLYKKEENNTITFNTVLTVHLSSTLTLPVTLKYDLKKPNLLGVFNLSWNFENSKSSSKN